MIIHTDFNVVNDLTLGHEAEAGGDGLVGGDAGHGHSVGGDTVREAGAQGSLAGNIGGLHFLGLTIMRSE